MKNKAIKNLFSLILGIIICFNLNGQGFVKFYGDEQYQGGETIINTSDGGFMMAGIAYSTTGQTLSINLLVIKIDSVGNEEWQQTIESNLINNIYDKIYLTHNQNGIYLTEIEEHSSIPIQKVNNYLFNEVGDILDTITFFNNNYSEILTTESESFFSYSELGGSVLIEKLDFNGDLIFQGDFSNGEFGTDVREAALLNNKDLIICGSSFESQDTLSAYIAKIASDNLDNWKVFLPNFGSVVAIHVNDNGNILALTANILSDFDWTIYELNSDGIIIKSTDLLDVDRKYNFFDISIDNNQDFILFGEKDTSVVISPVSEPIVIKINQAGENIWESFLDITLIEFFKEMTVSNKNEIFIIGETFIESNNNDFMLVKLDEEGNLFTNSLQGNVFQDLNENCQFDFNENNFENLIVEAIGNFSQYEITDENGNYEFLLDTGNYEIKVYPPSNYWESCEENYPISFSEFYDTTILNLPIQPIVNCPLMSVQISNNTLRPCPLPNKIIVQYCNEGTTTAESALLEVTLNEYMAVDSISIDPAAVTGDLYTFDLGDLAPFDCGQITFHFQLECDSVELGQTLCAEAHIYPDTLCLDPIWTGPVINVDGQCHPDSITFIIENEGDDMLDPQQYIIIEDNIILMQEPYQLLQGETQEITIPKMDEATYFMLAQQSSNLPSVLGNNYATVAVENCEALPLTSIFNQFPLDDAEPYYDEFCREVTGSYDPNDKQGFPTGFGEDHRIEQNVDLDYLIRFQNTGTDTAFTVVIRDNLSEFLDLTTLRPGASSHDYNLEIVNGRTLKFTFNNILLPDSTTNEPLSHGWVEFQIKQIVDNPIGTVIENRADIYFDGNAPILTNTTKHLIGVDFIDILDETTQIFQENLALKVYPNPAAEYAIFELKNAKKERLTFKLFNAAGQLQQVDNFVDNQYYFYRNGLTEGLYFYQIESHGELLVTGKLMLR